MTKPRQLFILATVLVAPFLSSDAYAQAYCALRDPVGAIYEFYPESDSHRSIVKIVGNSARVAIAEKLPLNLHFNELGKHTVYAAMVGDKPIGIVHARSEGDQWGLTEIVWALDLDLRVKDFSFQRCRNPARKELEESEFRTAIQGKSFAELRLLLNDEANELRPNSGITPGDASALGVTVLRSALKTIIVTETVWQSELLALRLDQKVVENFGQEAVAETVAQPYNQEVTEKVDQRLFAQDTGLDRDQVRMQRVRDEDGDILGYVIDSPWYSGTMALQLQWILGRDGDVLDVSTLDTDIEKSVHRSLARLTGFKVSDAASCANALELTAFELGVLALEYQDD